MANGAIEVCDFEKWLGERYCWLQTAAKNLIEQKRPPNEAELAELVRLCKFEASKMDDPGFANVALGSFSAATVRPQVRIEEVSQVFGVNAIKPGASLPFGAGGLTVIYGQNGSGKSGYARLLKQLCGSRSKDDIRPNIFSDENTPCSAQCRITIDGVPRDISWQPNTEPHAQLRHAQVFDSKTASQYMGKTESSYEPSSMRFISLLIQIADFVSSELTKERAGLVSALPQFPNDLADTAEKTWLSSLKASVTDEKIGEFCRYSEEMEQERVKIEALLAEKDIAGRLVAIGKDKVSIEKISKAMSSLKDGLSNETAESLFNSKEAAVAARKAAQDVAQKVFANSPLLGVGEAAWQQMWEQAHRFSVEHAYPGHEFPVTSEGAHCVLCQQVLSADAGDRLKSFELFMTAGLEATAKVAEAAQTVLVGKITPLPNIEDWIARLAQLHFDEATACAWHDVLQIRRARMIECVNVEGLPKFGWKPIEQALAKRAAELDGEEGSLQQLQQDGKRQELEARVKKLKALQWLSQNKPAILAERQRLNAVGLLDKAGRLTATNSLTAKRTELAKSELDAGYQARFAEELRVLGGRRLPVAPQSKAQGKGKITFGLTLIGARGNHPPEVVLSEGEARIVALAAFLADTTGSNQFAPFIFDDPISSLDQDFEERVVVRLVELAKSRQVIIFTHRLSLVALVEVALKKMPKIQIVKK